MSQGHSFDVDCRLPDYNDISTLSGNGSRPFDTSNGRAPLDGLSLSGFGLNMLECHVNSSKFYFLYEDEMSLSFCQYYVIQ